MKAPLAMEPSQREYLTMVQQSGEALLVLVNDILDNSKVEAQKVELEQAAFDLPEPVGGTV